MKKDVLIAYPVSSYYLLSLTGALFMRKIVKLVIFNHKVLTRGKLGGRMQIEGARGGAFWF